MSPILGARVWINLKALNFILKNEVKNDKLQNHRHKLFECITLKGCLICSILSLIFNNYLFEFP